MSTVSKRKSLLESSVDIVGSHLEGNVAIWALVLRHVITRLLSEAALSEKIVSLHVDLGKVPRTLRLVMHTVQ